MEEHFKNSNSFIKKFFIITYASALIFHSSVLNAQIVIAASINRAEPQNDFKNAYKPSTKLGYGFDLGYRINFELMDYTWDDILVSINYTRNYFRLQSNLTNQSNINPGYEAKIDKTCVGWQAGLYLYKEGDYWLSIFYGSKYGISRFLTNANYFSAADENTYTELRNRAGEVQYSKIMSQGVEVFYLNKISINYSFDLESIDKNFNFSHAATNAILVRGGSYIPYFVIRYYVLKNKKLWPAFRVFSIAYASAVQFIWFKIDYAHHNWPFSDVSPLHYVRQSLSFSYNFKI